MPHTISDPCDQLDKLLENAQVHALEKPFFDLGLVLEKLLLESRKTGLLSIKSKTGDLPHALARKALEVFFSSEGSSVAACTLLLSALNAAKPEKFSEFAFVARAVKLLLDGATPTAFGDALGARTMLLDKVRHIHSLPAFCFSGLNDNSRAHLDYWKDPQKSEDMIQKMGMFGAIYHLNTILAGMESLSESWGELSSLLRQLDAKSDEKTNAKME